jgi:hypothetical protein
MPSDSGMILHQVTFSFDRESRKRLQNKWAKLSKHVPDRCINVTYRGMFEVWSKTKARKPDRNGGWWEIPGFGWLPCGYSRHTKLPSTGFL